MLQATGGGPLFTGLASEVFLIAAGNMMPEVRNSSQSLLPKAFSSSYDLSSRPGYMASTGAIWASLRDRPSAWGVVPACREF